MNELSSPHEIMDCEIMDCDDDSLSSYTCYSSAASDDDSPEADEKRRIRQELDNAAWADMAEEKKRGHKEVLGFLDQCLRTVVCGPSFQQPHKGAHGCQQDQVDTLEEYYYDEEHIPESFWEPVHVYHGTPTNTGYATADLQLPIEYGKERARSYQEPIAGPSRQVNEGSIGCEQCFFVPICAIHGKGKGRAQAAAG
ncbi:hypothetical protein AC578_764 [Pseudocercospora eumusae]|uniref:Uncharacterized protein n=1 Tax=Pseudocercospora eumusae TaxID=321146 RepID=A0A139HMV3_9PEZI|nr:hypothetical protein AC578_764 [Pseudocercospora eumusae]